MDTIRVQVQSIASLAYCMVLCLHGTWLDSIQNSRLVMTVTNW